MGEAMSLRACPMRSSSVTKGMIVATFGGFLASAIKRVYGLKDFANFIPGHGGFMDRLDCQFLMALATFVHLRTFVLVNEDMNFTKVLRSAIELSPEGREKLCRELSSFP